MVLKNIYYASKNSFLIKGKTGEEFLTKYYLSREDNKTLMEVISIDVKTRGTLRDIASVAEEDYIKWCNSMYTEEWYKEKDYNIICRAVSDMGIIIQQANAAAGMNIESENRVPYVNSKNFRKLKDFEERALLAALSGKSFEPHHKQP